MCIIYLLESVVCLNWGEKNEFAYGSLLDIYLLVIIRSTWMQYKMIPFLQATFHQHLVKHLILRIFSSIILKIHFLRLLWIGMRWTVRTLESYSFRNVFQRVLAYDMPTRHHHRRVLVGALLFADRTHEYGVEAVLDWELDLDG